MVTMVKMISIFLPAYFIGDFSPAYLCAKLFGKLDIRQHGSGNAGTTNVIRVMGWRYGAGVFVLDIFKGLLAAWLGNLWGGQIGIVASGFGVVLGHDFPLLLRFKGGKGIAATLGVSLFIFPLATVGGAIFFVLIVLVTKMVSVGSLSFVALMLGYTVFTRQSLEVVLLALGLVSLAFLQHRENIQRILHGEENKLSLGKK